MPLDVYRVRRDHFEPDDADAGLCFPCNACRHRHGTDKDEPCIRCDWNLGADEFTETVFKKAGKRRPLHVTCGVHATCG